MELTSNKKNNRPVLICSFAFKTWHPAIKLTIILNLTYKLLLLNFDDDFCSVAKTSELLSPTTVLFRTALTQLITLHNIFIDCYIWVQIIYMYCGNNPKLVEFTAHNCIKIYHAYGHFI